MNEGTVTHLQNANPPTASPSKVGPKVGPSNYGKPWTMEQHALLVDRVRGGDELHEIATAIGRTPGALPERLRRLLPPDNRELPQDLLLPAAREFLSDADADWRGNLLKSTPPRPIITPPPIVRSGYGGIPSDDLIAIAYALIAVHGPRAAQEHRRLFDEVDDRKERHLLVRMRVNTYRYEPGVPVPEYQLYDAAEAWVEAAIDPDRAAKWSASWAPERRPTWGDNLGW